MRLLFLLVALLAVPATAEPAPPGPPTPLPRVALETAEGVIVLELETRRAPATSANFLRYVREKRLDGTGFYRAMKLTPDASLGLVQGGVKGDRARSLPPVVHEPTSMTGLSHVDGTVSLARAAPGTATADFFILVGDIRSLDADPSAPGDDQGFAAFGRVTEGMEVVRRILAAPTSPTAGEGVMRGQMLEPAITIRSARILP